MAAIEVENSWPWATSPGTVNEDEWRAMAMLFRSSGVVRNALNGFEVVQSGGQVRIRSGRAYIEGVYAESTTNKDHTPAAPHATLTRIDTAVVRANYVDQVVETDLIEGVPGTSPVPPALQQDDEAYEVQLAQVGILGGSGAMFPVDARIFAQGWGEIAIGQFAFVAGPFSPPGCLPCDGRAVYRLQYPELFSKLSTLHGAGDGSTTFLLPDHRGRFPLCMDSWGGTDGGVLTLANTLGNKGGTQTHTLAGQELPGHIHRLGLDYVTGTDGDNHAHAAPAGTGGFVVGDPGSSVGLVATGVTNDKAAIAGTGPGGLTQGFTQTHDHALPDNTGNVNGTINQPHNNMPPYIQIGVSIKVN